jgi:hypothetical protein
MGVETTSENQEAAMGCLSRRLSAAGMLLRRKPSQWEDSCLYPGSEEQRREVSAILTIQLFLLATHPPRCAALLVSA